MKANSIGKADVLEMRADRASRHPEGGPDRDAICWAGAALAVCAFTFTITIVLYVVSFGQPVGSGPEGEVTPGDSAAHVLAQWALISKVWLVEAVAWVLMAVAGFTLQIRPSSGPSWLPPRVAWLFVGVGAVVQALMYSFMLGGYPAAATGYEEAPALFVALRGAATFLFYLGNAAVYFGLSGAFLAETSPGGVVARWVALSGAVVCFVVGALIIGLLVGVGEMMFAAPGALLGFVLTIYLGVSIWRSE